MFRLPKSFSFCLGLPKRIDAKYRCLVKKIQSVKNFIIRMVFCKELFSIYREEMITAVVQKISYVRYADDFIVGTSGSFFDIMNIQKEIQLFLKDVLRLDLTSHEMLIIPAKQQFFFLGAIISVNHSSEKAGQFLQKVACQHSSSYGSPDTLELFVPIMWLMEELLKYGFVKRRMDEYKPTALRRIINTSHAGILGFYNMVSVGLMNYYSFADNYIRLGSIIKYYLLFSCALTLALKYKLRVKSKIFSRFGRNLMCPETRREFFLPKDFRRKREFKINPSFPETILAKKSLKRLLFFEEI